MIPEGFIGLVKLAMKEKPKRPRSTEEIWNKFLKVAFMGGKRSEPGINFLINIFKTNLAMDYVAKKGGEDWREEVEKVLDERMGRIKDEDMLIMLREFRKDIFRIAASIKGSARFFEKEKISPDTLNELLKTKESTKEFIENLAGDEDVSNVKYTKIIIWLHSMGYAGDFCPPSYQTKAFVNEIYGYYQFYEDDKYFMSKAGEFAGEIKKKIKTASVRNVATAIFYYITLKSMLPPRTREKSRFTCATLLKFLKAKKMTLKTLSESLSDFEKREKLMENLYGFVAKNYTC